MIKKIIFLFFVFIFNTFGFEISKISGETSYTKHKTESLNTSLIFEYNIYLYEPPHNKWGIFLSGKLNPQYDHFGNEVKMDVFTVLGIDF